MKFPYGICHACGYLHDGAPATQIWAIMYILGADIWDSINQLQRSTGVAPAITQPKSCGFLSLGLPKKQSVWTWIYEQIWFTQSNQHSMQVCDTNYAAEDKSGVSDVDSVLHFCGRQSFWTVSYFCPSDKIKPLIQDWRIIPHYAIIWTANPVFFCYNLLKQVVLALFLCTAHFPKYKW